MLSCKPFCGASFSKRLLTLLGCFIAGCLKCGDQPFVIKSVDEFAPGGKYLIVSRPLADTLSKLQRMDVSDGSILIIDNLQLCYILNYALMNSRDHLVKSTGSLKE